MAAKKKADAAVENTAEVTQETTEQVQDTVEQMAEDNKKELDNKKFVVVRETSAKGNRPGRPKRRPSRL